MVWRDKEGHAYRVRVVDEQGHEDTCGTGVRDRETAEAVESMVNGFRRRRQWKPLNLIVAGSVTLKEVFDAFEKGGSALDELLNRVGSPNLDVQVEEWVEAGANPKYVTHVREFIPKGEYFPAADFSRKRISKHIAKQKCSGATKNRKRSSLSMFGKFLVEREILDTNPVRDIAGYKEKARMVWYERADAWKVIDRLETQESRVLEALMYATGMELSACRNIRKGDIDFTLRNVFARGGKNKYRTRVVKVMDDRAWTLLVEFTRTRHPAAPVFTLSGRAALEHHKTAVQIAEVQDSTLHDWRHTFAVNYLREGGKPAIAKRQLGHAPNSTMVERVYAVWIVTERDYAPSTTTSATAGEK